MTDASSFADRYFELIDQIEQLTLKGQIRSKEQVYQMLVDGISSGTGEIFERCFADRLSITQQEADNATDELKQAKAGRRLRALKTVQSEWERWQEHNRTTAVFESALQQIVSPADGDRLAAVLRVTDPNQPQPLSLAQWQQLAKRLQTYGSMPNGDEILQISQGLLDGLADWSRLENHLVSWIYDQSQGQLGFEGVPGQRGPWATWAKQVNRDVPRSLFNSFVLGQSTVEWAAQQRLSLGDMVELIGVLRCLHFGLINWFDKLIYDAKVGSKLSISTFLAFAVIWSQLAIGLQQAAVTSSSRNPFVQACFQLTLQILRTFAQRDYFPLYGGIFTSFSGEYLRDALSYLDEPLRQAEGTQEKARILTLLGYSSRALGQIDRAIAFHQQAIDIARSAADRICEIANFNHLSRTYLAQLDYTEAINYSQRALILSRQAGDRLGEANAIASLGYSEILQAQALEQVDPDQYEMAIDRLKQGLALAERLSDAQSKAFCLSSLGIAHVVLEQPTEAIEYLRQGIQTAQLAGDFYLQGINLAYLAEAFHRLGDQSQTVQAASLGMYLLEQIGSTSWRQPANLLRVLRGQLGDEAFQQLLVQQRSAIVRVIGVDGFDHLPQLLEQ